MTRPAPLEIDPTLLRSRLNQAPFSIRHNLVGHPLLELPRLMELARRLPEADVEYNAGEMPVSVDPLLTPRTGLSVEETLRRIEECCSWMVLKRVESVPEYADLLNTCIDQVQTMAGPSVDRMTEREAFIFISSPRSVTPYHLDLEYNFLLQIRGTKKCGILPRAVLSQKDLEERFALTHRNVTVDEALHEKASKFELHPGEGVHIPLAAPHCVQNGDQVSISLSVTFRTRSSQRESALYHINARLRSFGIDPVPVRTSRLRDTLKYGAFQGVRLAVRPFKLLYSGARPLMRRIAGVA
jgi:cupin superfamily protein